ncbi:MAG: Hpt domain-containing protein [Pseudomonadota bacterium]|nr:Hpt domain-containing protein [Pseudomonadota bacterium]
MQAPINQSQLQELRELLDDEFDSLLHTYLIDSQKRLQYVQDAFEQRDNSKGYEAAHSLKGASANLGAGRLAELCLKLQTECKSGRISDAELLIQMIQEEQGVVSAYLLAQLN